MKRRTLLAAVWIGAALLALFFVLRTFVADVYRVESGSMEPTIHGGDPWEEWVLVRYDGFDELKRFDLAVAYKGGGNPVVKRIVGLPGENVQLLGGDLFIDGSRLEGGVPRPELVPLFDGGLESISTEFQVESAYWTQSENGWKIDSRHQNTQSDTFELKSNRGFDDGYLLPDLSRVPGSLSVNDGGVEFDLKFLEPGGSFYIDLREEGDCFRASLRWDEELKADGSRWLRIKLERFQISTEIGEYEHGSRLIEATSLSELDLRFDSGVTKRIHFSNVDNVLLFEVGEKCSVMHGYSKNRPAIGAALAPGRTIGAQLSFGGSHVHADLRNIRVLRDLFFTSRGEFGIDRPISLGPGEYFLLGDNSNRSLDGRTWGATPAVELLGQPIEVLWPRSRARPLAGELWIRGPQRSSPD